MSGELYSKFLESYLKANPSQPKKSAQEKAQSIWNGLKVDKKNINKEIIEAKILQWQADAAKLN